MSQTTFCAVSNLKRDIKSGTSARIDHHFLQRPQKPSVSCWYRWANEVQYTYVRTYSNNQQLHIQKWAQKMCDWNGITAWRNETVLTVLMWWFLTQSTKTFEPSDSIEPKYPSKHSLRLIVTFGSSSNHLRAEQRNDSSAKLGREKCVYMIIICVYLPGTKFDSSVPAIQWGG